MQDREPPPLDDASGVRHCRNCDAEIDSPYCGECGQDTRSGRLSFKSLAVATLDHLLNLDVPVLRTVMNLTWRPGWVAREYVRGRRKPFTNPLKYCFFAGALQIATCELLAIRIIVLPPGVQERLSEGPEGAAFREGAVPLLDWFGQYVHVFTFATLPILALFMKWLFRDPDRRVIEFYVLSLYTYGHSFLLQLFAVPMGGIAHPASYAIFKLIPLVYFSWAAVPFCRTSPWKGVSLSLAAHLAYWAVLVTFGLTIAALRGLSG